MKNITRESFLKNSVLGAAGIAILGSASGVFAEEAESIAYEEIASAEKDCDIVVIGGGISGLTAAVQAAELGAKVALLETNPYVGGNGNGTEGVFAVNSKYQQDAEPVDFSQIIGIENPSVNYRLNTLFWKDLYNNSADNIDWLEKQGVEFSGVVDNYYNLGHVAVFHWFKSGKGYDSFVPQMQKKAEELGVEILLESRGRKLIQDGEGVKGVYAELADGSVLKLSAKAVILATGGYASSADALEKRGFTKDRQFITGVPSCVGDGIDMAVEAGGVDVSKDRTFLGRPYIVGLSLANSLENPVANLAVTLGNYGKALWINEEGERFTDENCKAYADANSKNSIFEHRNSFVVVDSSILDDFEASTKGVYETIQANMEAGAEDIFKADTLEELAGLMGVDAAVLQAEVERYNSLCEEGKDRDFAKPSELLLPLVKGPYYAFRQSILFRCSIGGLRIDRKFRVLDEVFAPVKGLYAVGTDGCELYRESYGIEVPASCQGNNINSGRTAAKDAVSLL